MPGLEPCFCVQCDGKLVSQSTAYRHAHDYMHMDTDQCDQNKQPDLEYEADDIDLDMSDSDVHLSEDIDDDSLSSSSDSSDHVSSDSSDDDNDLPPDHRELAVQHATWFVEQRYAFKSTEIQVTQSMRTCRRLVANATKDQEYLDSIPKTFQQALARTKHLVLEMDEVHACVKDHHLFRNDDELTCPVAGCNEPRFARNGLPRRAAYYVNPEQWLRALLTVSKLCKQFDYMRQYLVDGKFRGEADDELRDFLSGKIFTDVLEPYIRAHNADIFKTVLCGLCHDEVEISRWPKKNICPVLLNIYNVPPWIRNLLTMIFMIGIMPPKCKNAQLYLEPIVEMFKKLGPAEDGFLVVSPITGLTETWYAMVAFDLNDMRGVSKGNCQVQAPAKKMACNDCAVTGYWIKCYHTTLYPSAVSFLPARDPLRAQYRRTFSKCSVLRDLAKQDHPRFITGMHIVLLYDVISIIILHVIYLYITCSIFILL